MSEGTRESLSVCLAGDWSISGVAEQFPLLAQHLSRLSHPQSSPESQTIAAQGVPEVDLAGVTALDACGCQLLAYFSQALQQFGIAPRLRNMPDSFIDKIRLLGFSREINLSI